VNEGGGKAAVLTCVYLPRQDLPFVAETKEEIKAKENMGILTNREQLRAVEVFNLIDKDDNQILTKLELAALFGKEKGNATELEKKAEDILMDYNVKDKKNSYIEVREWLHCIREIRADHGSAELFKLLAVMEARSKTMKVEKSVSKWREEGPAYVPKSKAFSHVLDDDPNQLNLNERSAAVWLFKALDSDGNELLTSEEVSKIMTQNAAYAHGADEDAKAMFAAMEENDDGHISMGEWLQFIRKIKRGEVPVVDDSYKGQKGAAKWIIEVEERVVKKPEDRKCARILQGDTEQKPAAPPRPPKIYEMKSSRLYTAQDRLKLEKWHVRKELLLQQMSQWRNKMSKDAAIFDGELKVATLTSDERAVAEAIWVFLDETGTQHVGRDELLDLFLLDTAEAIDLFGTMSKLLNPMHQPAGCVLSDWMGFLRKLKGKRGSRGIGAWFHNVGLQLADKHAQANTGEGDMGFQAALKGNLAEMKGQLKRVFQARHAAVADIERVVLEKKVAKMEAWQAKEAKIKHDLSIVPTRAFTGRSKPPPMESPTRSTTVELVSPEKGEKKSPGGKLVDARMQEKKKKKKKSPKRAPSQGFLSPKPVLPGRMQLSPIAKDILDPRREHPLTEEEVDQIAAHIVQQRRAMDPLLSPPTGASPQR